MIVVNLKAMSKTAIVTIYYCPFLILALYLYIPGLIYD